MFQPCNGKQASQRVITGNQSNGTRCPKVFYRNVAWARGGFSTELHGRGCGGKQHACSRIYILIFLRYRVFTALHCHTSTVSKVSLRLCKNVPLWDFGVLDASLQLLPWTQRGRTGFWLPCAPSQSAFPAGENVRCAARDPPDRIRLWFHVE